MMRFFVFPFLLIISASSVKADTWSDTVQRATQYSAAQNGGTADIRRSCQPEMRLCTTGIWYKNYNDGSNIIVRMTSDVNDNPIRRDICKFNPLGDIRTCYNVDTGASEKDMSDGNGHWTRVQ